MPKRYTTMDDVKRDAIIPTLDKADDYDVDAIAAETYSYRVDLDGDGNELLNTAGFEQIVDTDAYWAAVQRHALKSVLTPYDTGARLEPKVWQVNRLDLVNPERKDGADRYGKVDFELDDSSTALTIYVTQDADGITVHVVCDDEITITQHRE